MTIQLLKTGHLIAPLPTQPRTATHHMACLIHDENDNCVHAHIKAWPARSNGLANEIAGHLLHHAAGISTAPRAWIIALTSAELAALFPTADWGSSHIWPCWATEHIPGTTISGSTTWSWAAELAAWHDTPACIALHEWLWNIDGNAGNLVSTAPGDFAAIDHADILGGQNWTAKSLQRGTNSRFYNKILHIAWGGTPTPAQRLAAQQRATHHADILASSWPVIAHWWQALLKKSAITAAHRFLHTRAAPHWLHNRL